MLKKLIFTFMTVFIISFNALSAQAAGKPQKLDPQYTAQSHVNDKIIINKESNGVYFLKYSDDNFYDQYDVYYYDIAKKTYSEIFSLGNICGCYSDSEHIYFMHEKDSTFTADIKNDEYYNYKRTYYYELITIELATQDITYTDFSGLSGSNHTNACTLGVDGSGRVYIYKDDLLTVYTNKGKRITSKKLKNTLREFYGFDNTNGNFYYRGSYNLEHWGYEHYMACLVAGNLSSQNKLTLPEANLSMLFQSEFFEHKEPIEMLSDKYLAVLSGDIALLLNSNKYKVTDHSQQQSSINIANGGELSVSLLNIKNKKVQKLAVTTGQSEFVNDKDISSAGTRCALTSDNKYLVAKTQSNELTKFQISSQKEIIKATATYPIYKFAMFGNSCVAIEQYKDDFYIEVLDMKMPKTFSVSAPKSMNVGDSTQLKLTNDGELKLDYTFKSSDAKIACVDSTGKLTAAKSGTATITIKAKQINVSKKITITIKDTAESSSGSYSLAYANGESSNNMNETLYSWYHGGVTTSNLTQQANGTYERVEYTGTSLVAESYSKDFKLKSKKKIAMELPKFGGYYSGSDYNFIVFGQDNPTESKSAEVIRVVKYDKKWKRLSACNIKGANTYIPFDAGGLDMVEAGGKLYVHTCHEMFQSDDGLHHQANCTFVIKEKTMKLIDSFYEVANLSNAYVSHSFMQYIDTDGKNIYRADLGDACPRGIAYTQTKITDKVQNPSFTDTLIDIPGSYGYNYTGYTLDGLKVGDDRIITIGTGIKESENSRKNIWISVIQKEINKVDTIWLTDYASDGDISARIPKLAKINGNQFLVMWDEYNETTYTHTTKLLLINSAGNKLSDITTTNIPLSSCEPIVNSDGKVVWYVTNNSSPVFFSINPYKLAKLTNDTAAMPLFSDYTAGTAVVANDIRYMVTGADTVSVVGASNKYAKSITISSNITLNGKSYRVMSIGKGAFENMTKLQNVTICGNVKSIESRAFYGCSSLKKVSFKSDKDLKELGAFAFANCKSLTRITLPTSCYKLGASVFSDCTKLKNIKLKSMLIKSGSLHKKTFKGISEKATIYVPKKKLSTYKKVFKARGLNKKVMIKD